MFLGPSPFPFFATGVAFAFALGVDFFSAVFFSGFLAAVFFSSAIGITNLNALERVRGNSCQLQFALLKRPQTAYFNRPCLRANFAYQYPRIRY